MSKRAAVLIQPYAIWPILGLFAVLPGHARAQMGADSVLVAKIIESHEKYLSEIRDYQWSCKGVQRDLSSGKEISRWFMTCRQYQECGIMIDWGDDDTMSGSAEARVLNSKYGFLLKKKGTEGWVLKDYYPPEKENKAFSVFRSTEQKDHMIRFLPSCSLPVFYANRWIPDHLGTPAISALKEVVVDGRLYVRLDYSVPMATADQTVQDGHVMLDPNEYYLVHSFEMKTRFPHSVKTTSGTVAYERVAGVPVAKEMASIITSTLPNSVGAEQKIDYEFHRERLREADFTLTAFGLPEPAGISWERPTPRYVWLLLAAGICAALALGLRCVSRRKGPKPARGAAVSRPAVT